MIDYDPGRYSVSLIWQWHGSVFPKAFMWAAPSALLAFVVGRIQYERGYDFDLKQTDTNIGTMWAIYLYMLGFLCVFRTQQAYSRYMDGAFLLRTMRTEWINAVTNLVSFSNREEHMRKHVERFHHFLIRLMSLLSCYTLQSMADTVDDRLPVLSFPGLDTECTEFIQSKHSYSQRAEIIKQWIQRLVVEQNQKGVLKVEPPLLAQFFSDFNRGATCASQARNLTDVPFPFPYSQVISLMLMIHSLFTPLVAGLTMYSNVWGAAFTFISVLGYWATNYIACEIECPFGDDANDLPLESIQQDMNASLWILLEQQTQEVPPFTFDKNVHRKWSVQLVCDPEQEPAHPSPDALITRHSSQSGSTDSSPTKDRPAGKRRSPSRKSLFANQTCGRLEAVAGGVMMLKHSGSFMKRRQSINSISSQSTMQSTAESIQPSQSTMESSNLSSLSTDGSMTGSCLGSRSGSSHSVGICIEPAECAGTYRSTRARQMQDLQNSGTEVDVAIHLQSTACQDEHSFQEVANAYSVDFANLSEKTCQVIPEVDYVETAIANQHANSLPVTPSSFDGPLQMMSLSEGVRPQTPPGTPSRQVSNEAPEFSQRSAIGQVMLGEAI
jgi:predicted membrane chloride channel (bestrophin family)